MITQYRPSGQYGVLFSILLPVVAGVGIGISWVYQALIDGMPFIYVNIFLTLGLGALMGFLLMFTVEKGECRNLSLAMAAVLVVSAATVGGSHWWEYRKYHGMLSDTLEREKTSTVGERQAVLDAFTFDQYVELRAEAGWTVGRNVSKKNGHTFRGVFVYLVWLIEAGIVIGMTVFLGPWQAREPFSEARGAWASVMRGKLSVQGPTEQQVSQLRCAQGLGDLFPAAVEQGGPVNTWLEWSIRGHPDDPEEAFLTIAKSTVNVDKKGKATWHDATIWKNVVLQQDDIASCLEFFVQIEAQTEAAAAREEEPHEPADA